MELNVTVFLVVTDRQGNLEDYQAVYGTKYNDIQVLARDVGQEHTKLAQKYPDAGYRVNVGVADTIATLLHSYPEMRQSID